MKYIGHTFAIWIAVFFLTSSSQAHHSFATHYVPSQPFELEGRVVDFSLRSPHSFMWLDAENSEGEIVRWEIEAAASAHLQRMGVRRDTFQAGDQIKVIAWPNRQAGNPLVFGDAFVTADGELIGDAPNLSLEKDEVAQPADLSNLSGRWQVPYPRRLSAPPMTLNETGQTAWDNYDAQMSPANTCETSSIPGIWFAPFLADIRLNENELVIRYEHYAQVRRVPLSGGPVMSDVNGSFGRATAHIEGDTLVVESDAYKASGWGLALAAQVGRDIPSSAEKQIVERFSVIDGGNTVLLDFSIEDSVYLAEPYIGQVRLSRVADDEPIFEFECELDAAERFSR